MEAGNEYNLTEETVIRIFENEYDEKYNPRTHGMVNIEEIMLSFEEMIVIITNDDKTIEELGNDYIFSDISDRVAFFLFTRAYESGEDIETIVSNYEK